MSAAGFDRLAEVGILELDIGDQVDLPIKEPAQRFFEVDLRGEPCLGIKFDQEIEIAPYRIPLLRRGGAEQLKPAHMVLAAERLKLRLTIGDDGGDHRSAPLLDC